MAEDKRPEPSDAQLARLINQLGGVADFFHLMRLMLERKERWERQVGQLERQAMDLQEAIRVQQERLANLQAVYRDAVRMGGE